MISLQIIHRERAADNIRVSGVQQFGSFLQNIGNHQKGQIILLVFTDFFQ